MSLSAAKAAYSSALKAADLAAKAETDPAKFDDAMSAKADAYADACLTFVKSAVVNPTLMADAEARPISGTGDLS